MGSAQVFGAFLQHEGTTENSVKPLDKVHTRSSLPTLTPSPHELDELKWGNRLNGPQVNGTTTPRSATISTPTPRELEQSQPPSPQHGQTTHALVQSITNPPRNKWRFMSAAVFFLMFGLQDAVTGALIPYIESYYNITYSIVSLVFIAYAFGFLSTAPLVDTLDSKLGRSRWFMLATSSLTVGYSMLIPAPPFPVVVLAFFFMGFGGGGMVACLNSWVVNLMHGTVVLSCLHSVYGIGGVVAPILGTTLVSNGIRWSYFYCISLGFSTILIFTMGWSFLYFEEDSSQQLLTALQQTASRQAAGSTQPTKMQLLKKSLKNRTTLLGALFIFFYQGSEVAISGWVISYLIHYRDGNPAHVGNVTSGFWGGITLGRLVLTPLARRIGLKYSVAGLIVGAAIFQALVWAIPSIITDAVAESIVGFFLGPAYPCATAVFNMIWPSDIRVTSQSLVTSMGFSGGAFVPFVTGLMAQGLSTAVLHPIALFSFVVMMVSWTLLPKIAKRTD